MEMRKAKVYNVMHSSRGQIYRLRVQDVGPDHVLGSPGDIAPLVDETAAVPSVWKDQRSAPPRFHAPGLEPALPRGGRVKRGAAPAEVLVQVHEKGQPGPSVPIVVVLVGLAAALLLFGAAPRPSAVNVWPVDGPGAVPVQPEPRVDSPELVLAILSHALGPRWPTRRERTHTASSPPPR